MIPSSITSSPAYCGMFQNTLTGIFYNIFTYILPLLWSVLYNSNQNVFCQFKSD